MDKSEKEKLFRTKLPCPQCDELSDSLKMRNQVRGIFLLIVCSQTSEKFVICPKCVRKDIAKRFFWNLLGYNLIFPFIFLFVELPQLIGSFFSGHCQVVRDELEKCLLSTEEKAEFTKNKKKQKKRFELILILVIFGLFAALLISLLCLSLTKSESSNSGRSSKSSTGSSAVRIRIR